MNDEDLKLLTDWFAKNKDHKLNFLEKEAIKLAVKKAATVGDLLETALGLLIVRRSALCAETLVGLERCSAFLTKHSVSPFYYFRKERIN